MSDYQRQVTALVAQLGSGVADLLTSDRWAEALRVQARFHNYSWTNAFLISLQRPDATRVAGFHRWLSLGRRVKKGERGIRIIAPYTVTVQDPKTGQETEELVGFRQKVVFDVSQTDGPPLPDPAPRLTGNSRGAQRLLRALKQVIQVPVAEETTVYGVDGYYDLDSNRIVVSSALSANGKAAALVHEYVHSLLHRKDLPRAPREHQETVAEGVAFVVCSHFGLDTRASSFGYVAGWAGSPDLIWTLGREIQRTACDIIARIEAVLPPGALRPADTGAGPAPARLPVINSPPVRDAG